MRQAGDTMTDRNRRQEALSVLTKATLAELREAVDAIPGKPEMSVLRPAEIGLVMVRGRIGGDGDAFNLGEATVARAAIALPTGEIGHGHVLGRDKEKAQLIAVLDALGQAQAYRESVETLALTPIRARLTAERERLAARTAATRVDFFTVQRGED
jgi:alpha-D-ribose 1-methylphosphonate 5-triphosphate synthase subunit PhnG